MAEAKMPDDPPPEYAEAASPQDPALRAAAPARLPVHRPPPPLSLPIINSLNSKRVILASASPRRKALLQQLGLSKLEVRPSRRPEDVDKSLYGPYEYAAETARRKCLDVYAACLKDPQLASVPDPGLVIAADTIIITRDGRILEKPQTEADHIRMLRLLRDTRMHTVLTAVSVLAPREDARHPGYCISSQTAETKVYFYSHNNGLPDDVIDAYVKTREGADKAGGYALQGVGGMLLVEKIEGGVDNVIGLPVRTCLSMAEKVIFRQEEDEFDEEHSGED